MTIRYTPTPGGALATKSTFVTANVNLANDVDTEVTSVDLTAGTWLVIATALNATEGATCDIDIWLDSVSGAISASPYGSGGLTQNTPATTAFSPQSVGVVVALVVLTAPQTVYLNAVAEGQNGVLNVTNQSSIGGATGIVAVKVA